MRHFYYTLLLLTTTALISCQAPSEEKTGNQATESNTPEALGVSSQAILDFIDAAERERPNDLHSFVLLRHGKKVASGWWDPYDPETPHMLYSLSKSFTSTAVGLAQAEGLLSIDDPVISFFPDETPENPSENLKSMRIRDLLKMNSGHQQEPRSVRQNKESWVKAFLATEIEHKPGTHFVYNSMATFMLSAIVQKVSGERVRDFLMPRLFEPLGIEKPTWDQNMNGIDYGGWGLYLRTEDIAKFGQLYLQKGMWNGQQLIPEDWVEEATSYQTSNGSNPDSDWEQGYGYQFWMCRHGLYRGDGAFGQYCIVMPEQDAVLAITSGTRDMQAIMNLAWDYLLPALKDEPLETNEKAYQALQERTANLKLAPVDGEPKDEQVMERISNVTYQLEDNDWGLETISFSAPDDKLSMTFNNGENAYTVPIGYNEYEEGEFDFDQVGLRSLATSGAWIAGDTLELMMYLDETPHGCMEKVSFDGDKMTMEREFNVFLGPTKQKALVGTAMR